jgi:hypothetical protein
MKTYVKVFGPPLVEALDQLQKIAADMPEMTHYHILSDYAGVPLFPYGDDESGQQRQLSAGGAEKSTHSLISKSGHTLGDHDFFFEWKDDPTWDEMRDLIGRIDKAFKALGCTYTLTTK